MQATERLFVPVDFIWHLIPDIIFGIISIYSLKKKKYKYGFSAKHNIISLPGCVRPARKEIRVIIVAYIYVYEWKALCAVDRMCTERSVGEWSLILWFISHTPVAAYGKRFPENVFSVANRFYHQIYRTSGRILLGRWFFHQAFSSCVLMRL